MDADALVWLALAGLAGWNIRMQWWIAQHHKSCHSEPQAAAAALAARVAGCEEECERLARNAHDDRSTLGAVALDVELIKRQ